MTKHNTPQQEFYTEIKYVNMNSGKRQKTRFSDQSRTIKTASWLKVSIYKHMYT